MRIIVYMQVIFFIMLGIVFYKAGQDKFDKVVSVFIIIAGVIALILHLTLQGLTLYK